MKTVLVGPVPAWVSACSDEVLRSRLGEGTRARGEAYANANAVVTVTSMHDGALLAATVLGSGRKVYQTKVLTHDGGRAGALGWSGHCSCPMQVDCKHVAAVLFTVRAHLRAARGEGQGAPSVGGWQAQLAELVRPPSPTTDAAVLGFQLEVVGPAPTRAGESGVGSRVRVRAVTPGKAGRWIRTGVTWRDLDSGYSRVKITPAHRDVVRSALATFRSRQPPYSSIYSDVQLHLDDLGPTAWRVLAEAQAAGIALVSVHAGQQVVLASSPATVALDLRRSDPAAEAVMSFVLRTAELDLAVDEVSLVGRPAHGAFRDDPAQLLLVSFDRPLDPTTHGLLVSGGLRVPAADLPVFFSRYYPSLRQRVTVESLDGSVEIPEIEPPFLHVKVDFEADHLTRLVWQFGYPTAGEVLLVDDHESQGHRDLVAEQALLSGVELPGRWTDDAGRLRLPASRQLTGIETALFVEDVLPVLQARKDLTVAVTGTPVAYVQNTDAPLISVATHDASDGTTDWFDLQVSLSVGGQDVELSMMLTALAQEQEHLILPSGTWFRLDRPELQSLRRLVEEARSLQDKESTGLRLTAFHAGLWEELVSLGVVEHQSTRWTQTVGALLELDQLPQPDPPEALLATLRPYQLEGYHWLSLLWDHQLGGILADDMGLGKTVQTLAMVARARAQGTLGGTAGPLLVVAPTSVVGTWAKEAARFVPDLSVLTITETQHRSGLELAEAARDADLVVTSYALFRIDEEAYRTVSWSGLVLDEAQFVKNHQAKTYQCARRLPTPFKLAITGTPLENSLMDLWSMLSITAPGLFPNPERFTTLFRKPIESGESPEQLAALRRRIRPLMLRRTKEAVAPDLPPKIEQTLEVTLNPQHRKVYDKHLARERQRVLGLLDDLQRNRIAILRSLTLLRQLSLDASLVDAVHAGRVRSSKIDVLLEQLREVVAEGHRVLVFSQFTGFLALVKAQLESEGIGYCYLDGRTRNRPQRIAEFTDGHAPVFLISLKAGGVGLTLTEADYVFVLDPWWNPAAEAQAVDRTHRIGQTKTVMVYRLVATDTIEEKVVALQQRKKDLFSRVVDDGAMMGVAMTAEDIRGLFR